MKRKSQHTGNRPQLFAFEIKGKPTGGKNTTAPRLGLGIFLGVKYIVLFLIKFLFIRLRWIGVILVNGVLIVACCIVNGVLIYHFNASASFNPDTIMALIAP